VSAAPRASAATGEGPARPAVSAAPGRASAAPGRRFGEEGGVLTYGGYLRLAGLLGQQVPQADPPAHDELLFITVHQAYELWFKQALYELEAARDAMTGGELWRARHLLGRVHVIERLLIEQIEILETMTPQDFLEFRSLLAPASGFQSAQFREIEFLSGAKDAGYLTRFRGLTDEERGRLRRRLSEPTLWDAYLGLLASRGLPVGGHEHVLRSLVTVASDRASYDDLWQLAEDLITHDELSGLWRARHVQMVERQIGTKSGTGGSTGAPYLRERVALRYYPLLWELRAWL
jgi:tryptophan 2,3-dioxygenase